MKQRDIFLSGEGNEWFNRNVHDTKAEPAYDFFLHDLCNLPLEKGESTNVAEIGCGQGFRLQKLAKNNGWKVYGLDPSSKSVDAAKKLGINAQLGTADELPYLDKSLDLLIFGFCLYLCDRDDLFRICAEAHRVLKPNAWLAILDFWSPSHRSNPYHHKEGVQAYKSNLPAMFCWHPDYVITDHRIRHHSLHSLTDDQDQWVGVTVIRKLSVPSA